MKLVSKMQKIYKIIVGDTRESKIEALFDHVIDKIEIIDDNVHIKTSKNIIIENDGHSVMINRGVSVNLSHQIHLNPKINFGGFDILQDDLQLAYEAEMKALQEKHKNAEFVVHDCSKKKKA